MTNCDRAMLAVGIVASPVVLLAFGCWGMWAGAQWVRVVLTPIETGVRR